MKRLLFALLCSFLFVVSANSQTFRGAINGTVTDPSGAAVPNATVKATESTTGIDHTTVTTNEGQFVFQDIPLGFYKVSVVASGFPALTVDKVEVVAGSIYTLNVQLKMGGTSTSVEVSAAALTLDTTTATQNMTISEKVMDAVPIAGRDFTQLIGVQPGAGGINVGGFVSVNGTRGNQVDWQIDGVDNNDFWHNIPAVNQGGVAGIAGVILPMDSVSEFSSQTQSGSEAGRNAGGTVNLTIKSGGNAIHGSLYYYDRNEAFAAHSPFFVPSTDVPKAPPNRNENYGFWLGGPFIKNKLFYSVGYEKNDFLIGLAGLATQPSAAWVNLAKDILNNPGGKYGGYAPVAVSPTSQNLIGPSGYWPQGNTPGSIANAPLGVGNYFSPVPAKGYSYNGVVKLDYNINDKHRIFFHWFGGQGNQIAPLGLSAALSTASSIDPFYYEGAPIHVFNYSLVLNSTFSSRLTNQVLIGANYFNQVFFDNHNNIQPGSLGLKVSPDLHLLGASELQIHGFDGVGVTNPNGRNDITYHITDEASYVQGAHQMRFGAEFRFANVNEFYHRRGRGRFTFDGSQGPWAGCSTAACSTLNSSGLLGNALALADFMAGDVLKSQFALGNPERTVRVNAINAHFQDSWQITRNFNLNLGLRWEYFGPLHNGDKDLAFFDQAKGFRIQGVSADSIFPPDRRAFAPRLGFAYHANNFGGWVLRGNFGVYYDQINMNPFLDNHVGSDGVEGNPFGPKPYPLFTTNILGQKSYNWDKTMAASPNGFIFPAVQGTATTVGALCQNAFCTTPKSATYAGDPQNLGVFSVNQNFRTPYYFNYSLQIEKSLGDKVIAQIGYVGSEGRKLSIFGDINQNGAFPQFSSVIQLSSTGTSNYNSLQAQLRTNSWHNLSGAIGYTWAHALDEVSEYRGVTLDDAFNRHFDYGNSDFDTRHLFTISMVYDVPKASWATGPWANRLWNGWQFSTLTNFHTGQPSDDGRLGLDLIADPYAGANHSFVKGVGEQWWNGNAFAEPLSGPGNLSRNKLYGPGFGSVDVSVIKNVPVTERLRVQLRADMFNIFNRKNLASVFGGVNSGCGDVPTKVNGVTRLLCGSAPGGFGWVQDTISDSQAAPGIGPGEPFQIQLAAKIIF